MRSIFSFLALIVSACGDANGNGQIVGMTIGGTYIGQGQSYAPPVPTGPNITNSQVPACDGLSIVEVARGLFNGVPGVEGVYVKVSTTSSQRKWIQADIKYYSEIHTALQNTAGEYWETTKPLIMRPGDGVSTFWVKSLQDTGETNFRITAVNVIGCGT